MYPSCSFYAVCQNGYVRVALSLKTSHCDVFTSLCSARSPSHPYPLAKKEKTPCGADDVCLRNVYPSCSFYAVCQNGYVRVALSLKTVHRTVFAAFRRHARLRAPIRKPKRKDTLMGVFSFLERMTGLEPATSTLARWRSTR